MKGRTKRIPRSRSDTEAARFWDTHSVADYWDDLEEVHDIRFVRAPKRVVAIRLDEATLRRVKALALRKGISYSTLLRTWVIESARREAKK